MDDELIDFLIEVVTNSHKCQHCTQCFHGDEKCACINAYTCIANDFSEYDEGD